MVPSVRCPAVEEGCKLCPDKAAWCVFADPLYGVMEVVGWCVRSEGRPVVDTEAEEAGWCALAYGGCGMEEGAVEEGVYLVAPAWVEVGLGGVLDDFAGIASTGAGVCKEEEVV